MLNKEPSKIAFAPSLDFARHSRNVVFNEGALIISGMGPEALQSFIHSLGTVVKQHDGNDVFNVKPSASLGALYHSRTMNAVPPHTDGHDLPLPPKLFLLLCVQPSAQQDGLTELSNVAALLESLSEGERSLISEHQFSFETKPSALVMNGAAVNASIFDPERDIFRYSYNYLSRQSSRPEVESLVEKISHFHDGHKQSVLLDEGDLLVCDNHRVLHSRTGFSGADRHLIRAWVN